MSSLKHSVVQLPIELNESTIDMNTLEMFKLNEDELILMFVRDNHNPRHRVTNNDTSYYQIELWKHCIINNNWIMLTTYLMEQYDEYYYDQKTNKLYVENGDIPELAVINIFNGDKQKIRNYKRGNKFIIIKNQIFAFDSYKNYRISTIGKNNTISDIRNMITNIKYATSINFFLKDIIYVQSPNFILMIGSVGHSRNGSYSTKIYKYCIQHNVWKNTNISIKGRYAYSILTSDSKQLIIFNDFDIYILQLIQDNIHLKKLKWNISSSLGQLQNVAVTIGGIKSKQSFLVSGFIRKLWKTATFENLRHCPWYLKNIIEKYYCYELIYFVNYLHTSDKHQINKIYLNDIFS